MNAIDTLIGISEEAGFVTDDVCEALAFLGSSEEISRWNFDEMYADDFTVVHGGLKSVEFKCSTAEGIVHITIDIVGGSAVMVDEWTPGENARHDW